MLYYFNFIKLLLGKFILLNDNVNIICCYWIFFGLWVDKYKYDDVMYLLQCNEVKQEEDDEDLFADVDVYVDDGLFDDNGFIIYYGIFYLFTTQYKY